MTLDVIEIWSDGGSDDWPWPISGDQITKSRMDAVHASRASRR